MRIPEQAASAAVTASQAGPRSPRKACGPGLWAAIARLLGAYVRNPFRIAQALCVENRVPRGNELPLEVWT